MDYNKIVKKYLPLVLILLIGLIIGLNMHEGIKDLKSIPACLYGCDYYYENGITLDLMNNPGNTWQSSTHDYLNLTNSLPKSHGYTKMLFSELKGYDYLESWKSVFLMSYFFIFIGLFGWFIFYKKLFRYPYLSIALSVITMNISQLPYFKYNSIIIPVMPYFLYLILKLHEKNNKRKLILIIIGLILLSLYISNIHAMSFFIIYIVLIISYILFVLKTINPKKIIKKLKRKKTQKKTFIYSIIAIVSLIINILLGWWYKILFIFGEDKNAFKFDIHANLTVTRVFFSETIKYIKRIFLNFSSLENVILSISLIIGLIIYIYYKKSNKIDKKNVILWVILIFFISVFNYIITSPLLHKQLSPKHAIAFLLPLLLSVILGFTLIFLTKIKGLKVGKTTLMLISMILIIITLIGSIQSLNERFDNKFWKNGKNEIPEYYSDLAKWSLKNYNPKDMIILSTNELSFALNGIIGTKHITGRQSHFFHFGDFQEYWLDAGVILYGENNQTRFRLLKKYVDIAKSQNKKIYLYWDNYWIRSEWIINEKNINPFDPLRFEDKKEYSQVLDENKIEYIKIEDAIFEPSAQNKPNAYKMDIIYISPENYNNFTHPWKPDLDNYLKEVWSYKTQGQKIAKIYEINI